MIEAGELKLRPKGREIKGKTDNIPVGREIKGEILDREINTDK